MQVLGRQAGATARERAAHRPGDELVPRPQMVTNQPSLEHLDPDLVRDLRVGDSIPDGPPGTAQYVVDQVSPPRSLVLRSTTHVPPGWDVKYGARITWTWCFTLTPIGDGGRTRLHLRVRGRMSPWWFAALYLGTVIPADYVMATGMLRGLKRRAEAQALSKVSGRASPTDASG